MSQNPVASPTVTAQTVTATAAVRPWIYDLLLGSSATPADNALVWKIQRFTAAGTNTAFTPPPLDTGDPACTSVAGITNTVEPTYTSAKILLHWAANQRSAPRINLDPTAPLLCPATANNGLGLYAVHASFTGNVDATTFFKE